MISRDALIEVAAWVWSVLMLLFIYLLLSSYPAGAVTFNNAGGITSSSANWSSAQSVGSGSASTVSMNQQVMIAPPGGAPASPAQGSAALGGALMAASAGVWSQQFPVTGQLALQLGMELTTAAMMAPAGPVGVAFAAMSMAQAGQTGAALYKALQANGGIGWRPDGSVVKSGPSSSVWGNSSFGSSTFTDPGAACASRTGLGAACVMSSQSATLVQCRNSYDGTVCGTFSVVGSVPGASTPATASDIATAMQAVTNQSNADFNVVAADLAAMALQQHLDMNRLVNATDAAALSTSQGLNLSSPYVVVQQATDAAGNTTSLLSRNTLSVPPCGGAGQGSCGSLSPVVATQSASITNGVPQTSTTTVNSGASQSLLNLPVVQTAQQANQDLCVQHPDALACSNDANEGDVPDQPLKTKNITVSLNPFVIPSGAGCMAPVSVGAGKMFDVSGFCTFLSWLHPLMLSFAYLTAGMIFFSGRPYA